MSPWRTFRTEPTYYEERADGLLASAADGTPSAVAEFTRWSAPLTVDGSREVVARGHGYGSWAELLDGAGQGSFGAAYRLVEARDLAGLASLLDREPALVTEVGTNGNDLLGLAASTCDERLVALLLSRGADVRRANVHGWTVLHQAGYSNLPALARVALDAGAPVDGYGRGDGGTPLVAALFWGHVEVARVLAAHGVVPRNLRTAAGLDDVALLESLWDTPSAGAHRGFYRPHSGFPVWRPGDSPAEVRDEALSWAAGRTRWTPSRGWSHMVPRWTRTCTRGPRWCGPRRTGGCARCGGCWSWGPGWTCGGRSAARGTGSARRRCTTRRSPGTSR